MGKESGLGDNFYIDSYDLSGTVNSLQRIGGGPAPWIVTTINQSAMARQGLRRDGAMEFVTFMDVTTAMSHDALSGLPTTDRVASYYRGTAIGSPAACQVAKQINYDPTRPADGSLTLAVSALPNGYGIEWGTQLTAGKRTDTSATNGTSYDGAASTSFGWAAFLNVFSFTGTDVTISIEDSANNSAFSALTGGAFTQTTAAGSQRIASSSTTATVRRYVRAVTSTTGGFTSVTFAVMFSKHPIEVTY